MLLLIIVCAAIYYIATHDFNFKKPLPPPPWGWEHYLHPRCPECIYFDSCKGGADIPTNINFKVSARSEQAAKSELFMRVPCAANMNIKITTDDV